MNEIKSAVFAVLLASTVFAQATIKGPSGGVKLSGVTYPYTAVTTTYSITNADHFISCSGSTSYTVTLPTAVGIAGQKFEIEQVGTGILTVATTSSQTIDGATTQLLASQYTLMSVISDGANWHVGPSYNHPPGSHATYSHSANLTITTDTAAHPVPFDTVDTEEGNFNQAESVVTITNATPAVVTWAAHGLIATDVVVLSTTGALPDPLVAGTKYYVSSTSIGANDFKLSLSVDNALAGTNIATTTAGSGVHTMTAQNVIVVPDIGDYLVAVSPIFDSTSGSHEAFMWLNLNGTNIPRSNTEVTVGASAHSVASVAFTIDFAANDKFRLYFGGASNNIRLVTVPAAASPTRPASPSVILTLAKIGR